MAVGTGFSHLLVALYNNEGTTVTHTSMATLGRSVNISLEVETADDNNFYADNEVAESVNGIFTGGSGTATVDGVAPAVARMIWGLAPAREVQVDGASVSVQGYGASEPPFVSIGYIYRTMMEGVTAYVPTIITKAKFSMPSNEYNTQEEDIEWQTQELGFTFYRDDTAAHEWKYEATTGYATEAEAVAFLEAMLGA